MSTITRILAYGVIGLVAYILLAIASMAYAMNAGAETSLWQLAIIFVGQLLVTVTLVMLAYSVRFFGLICGLVLVVGGITGRLVAGSGRIVEGTSPIDVLAMWQAGSLTMIAVSLGAAIIAVGILRWHMSRATQAGRQAR